MKYGFSKKDAMPSAPCALVLLALYSAIPNLHSLPTGRQAHLGWPTFFMGDPANRQYANYRCLTPGLLITLCSMRHALCDLFLVGPTFLWMTPQIVNTELPLPDPEFFGQVVFRP
jgi:hypothetical protein